MKPDGEEDYKRMAFWVRYYDKLTDNQKKLYDIIINDLEGNPSFMDYVKIYNKYDTDAIANNMYININYKISAVRWAIFFEDVGIYPVTSKKIILDIGCGTGYFSYFAKKFGHEVYSMDSPLEEKGTKIFIEGQQALGISVIYHTIEAFKPLPVFDRKFSLITAFAAQFNSDFQKAGTYWRVNEWKYFINDVKKYLTDDGLLHMRLPYENSAEKDVFCSDETWEYFRRISEIKSGHIINYSPNNENEKAN